MESREIVEKIGVDGELVEVGPPDLSGDFKLFVPNRFTRRISRGDSGRVIELEVVFRGDKLEITALRIEDKSATISSRDLLYLGLPRLIRLAALTAIPDSGRWESGFKKMENVEDLVRNNQLLLAKLYWFEHITWGSPRVVIQDLLKCKKTTANYYIKLASDKYPLPASRIREPKKRNDFSQSAEELDEATAKNIEW